METKTNAAEKSTVETVVRLLDFVNCLKAAGVEHMVCEIEDGKMSVLVSAEDRKRGGWHGRIEKSIVFDLSQEVDMNLREFIELPNNSMSGHHGPDKETT